jgi:polar amino acid transport system permease protein
VSVGAASRSSPAAESAPARAAPSRRGKRRRADAIDLAAFVLLGGGVVWFAVQGAQSMGYNWQWFRVQRYLWRVIDGEIVWGPLVQGLVVTLQISALATAIALALGLLVALMRLSDGIMANLIAGAYVEAIRNTPILVQMLIFYFIIAQILGVNRFWSGVLCLALYQGAFASEIVRAGILSVRRGQSEAARSLGLGPFDTYRDVILPQAVPLMLPPLAGVLVNLVKHSAIVSVIAIFDLTTQGRTIVSDTFLAFEIWLTVAAMYLVVTLTLSALVAWLERRVARR